MIFATTIYIAQREAEPARQSGAAAPSGTGPLASP